MDSSHDNDRRPDPAQPDLADLIAMRKGTRSYARLSRDAGGYPTGNRIQQLASEREWAKFPDPDTLRGLARALSLPMSEIVMAAARTVGLPVPPRDPTVLMIAGAGDLPPEAKDMLLTLARDLIRSYGAASGDHAARGMDTVGDESPPAVRVS